MKNLINIILVSLFVIAGITGCNRSSINEAKLNDSIRVLNERINITVENNKQLFSMYKVAVDSISTLNREAEVLRQKQMTEQQFLDLYDFQTVKKYWSICKRNPSQKKYLMGWLNRIFEK